MARVSTGQGLANNYGYIDTKGKFIIKPQYWDALPFKEGISLVKKYEDPNFYIIDKKGNIITKLDEGAIAICTPVLELCNSLHDKLPSS